MSEPSSPEDIVAELDRWLQRDLPGLALMAIQRARDEIVALRDTVERQRFVLSKGHAEVRAEERERCARICERMGQYSVGVGAVGFTEAFMDVCNTLAASIRTEKQQMSEERTSAPKRGQAED